MVGRALVLGGGGTVGIAWEIGVLNGLLSAGVNIADADLVVGTSAGSVVGTQLALGLPLDVLLAEQLAPFDPQQNGPLMPDLQVLQAVFATLMRVPDATPEVLGSIGRLALSAKTVGEDEYLRRFALLHGAGWPQRRLLITSVDAESGAFQVWDRGSGAALDRAVASSCAVPGLFPPVSIDGRRYIDGGMRSATNADLATGYDSVLIVTPVGPQGATGRIEGEAARLRENGSRVAVVAPDGAALAAFGPNMMDTARRGGAAQAGVRQGTAAVEAARAVWEGEGADEPGN